jgi:hypothetical protein
MIDTAELARPARLRERAAAGWPIPGLTVLSRARIAAELEPQP